MHCEVTECISINNSYALLRNVFLASSRSVNTKNGEYPLSLVVLMSSTVWIFKGERPSGDHKTMIFFHAAGVQVVE